MPPLRQIFTAYPFDDDSGIALGAPGIWFWLTTAPGFVGMAASEYPPVPTRGSREQRRAEFEVVLNEKLQALCEVREKIADIPDDDIRKTEPEPFCRYDGDDYVKRIVVIHVPVKSINPVVLDAATVSNGASRLVRV